MKKNINFGSDINRGISDLVESVCLFRLWIFWGWLDVRQRYRRSLLGPLWVTGTMAISIGAIALVYSLLFKQSLREYLPFVASGYVIWSLITGYIGEASAVFIQNEAFIGQLRLPYFVYPLRLFWRYISIFFHHAIVLFVVLMIFVPMTWGSVTIACIGLMVTCLNILWMGLLVGLVSVRMRDLPILIATIFQVLFLVTPVIWPAKALAGKAYLIEFNPFYHMLESIREPLLDLSTPLFNQHLIFSVAMAVLGSLVTLVIYSLWRRRLQYWL